MSIDMCPACSSTAYDPNGCRACGYTAADPTDSSATSAPPKTLSRAAYTAKFRAVLEEVVHLARGPKTTDYGEAWADTGLRGIYLKIMIKEARLRSLVWNRQDPATAGESVRDTLLDLVAYATYGVIALDNNNIDGPSDHHAKRLAQALAEITKELK